jgi:hypothetical protein
MTLSQSKGVAERPKHFLVAWACHGRWPLILFFSTVALATFWRWFLMASVITFGAPGKTYFSPDHAAQGSRINWCVDDVVLYRLCRSKELMRLTPAFGRPIELTHTIEPKPKCTVVDGETKCTPPRAGRIDPKCRPFDVPKWDNPNEGVGEATLTGIVRSECTGIGFLDYWFPVIDEFPTVKLVITK